MLKRKSRRNLSICLILVFLLTTIDLSLFIPAQIRIEENRAEAAGTASEAFPIQFGGTSITAAGYEYTQFLPTKSIRGQTLTADLSTVPPERIDRWEVEINGRPYGSVGTIQNGRWTFTASGPEFADMGVETLLEGKSYRNPGHMIWRDPNGKEWQTTGELSGTYRFAVTSGECYNPATGVSDCPYPFPSNIPDELEYNGAAVTSAYAVPPPDYFYINGNRDFPDYKLPNAAVDLNTVRITNATPVTRGVHFITSTPPDEASRQKVQPGYGYMRLWKNLNKAQSVLGRDYTLLPGGDPDTYLEGRNYIMDADAQWEAKTYAFTGKVTVYYKDGTPPPPPTGYTLTGDFDILPSQTIKFRDSFTFRPKNFQIDSKCVYQRHYFRIQRSSFTYTSPNVYGQSTDLTYTYSTYPYLISINASHQVTMKIVAVCEGKQTESSWIGPKTLFVEGPENNRPPYFRVGWFEEGDRDPEDEIDTVIQGEVVDVRLIEDPDSDPPSPSDPDGDDISWVAWDFASSSSKWIRDLPTKYPRLDPQNDVLTEIVADEPGYHTITGIMEDEFGARSQASATLRIVPPNPVPVIDCPDEVKSRRPVDMSKFSSARSYSPYKNRTIDHSRDEWTNKKSMYINDTLSDTYEQVKLHVYDNTGLKSLSPDTCSIKVKPDLPPVAKLGVPPLGIRGQTYDIYNLSTSPDGDQIVSIEYRYKYDSNNNGFADDPWVSLPGNMTKASITPNRVGKYLFYAKVTEDYGKTDDTLDEQESLLTLDVVNLEPEVSFKVKGKNPQPDVSLPTFIDPAAILNSWALYETNSTRPIDPRSRKQDWSVNGGALVSGVGKLFEYAQGFFRNSGDDGDMQTYWDSNIDLMGFGTNKLSPYRAAVNTQFTVTLAHPEKDTDWVKPQPNSKFSWFTNKKYFYYLYNGKIWAMNKSKIGPTEEKEIDKDRDIFRFTWLNGSPYDFSIPVQTTKPYSFYDPDEKQWVTLNISANLLGWQLADRTIYVALNWGVPYDRSYDGDGGYYYSTKRILDIITYDAYTGQKVTSTWQDQGLAVEVSSFNSASLFSKNDNLILFTPNSHHKGYEFNRHGQKLREVPLPPAPEIYFDDGNPGETRGDQKCVGNPASNIFRGPNGEFFYYETYGCYERGKSFWEYLGPYYPASVVKVNPDFTLGWRVQLKYQTVQANCDRSEAEEKREMIYVDPFRNVIVVESYREENRYSYKCDREFKMIDIGSGNGWEVGEEWNTDMGMQRFRVDWNGNIHNRVTDSRYDNEGTTTIEGFYTRFSSDELYDTVYNANHSQVARIKTGNSYGSAFRPDEQKMGEYIGDGLYLSLHELDNNRGFAFFITKGTPSTDPAIVNPLDLGQFVSPNAVGNAEMGFTMQFADPLVDSDLAGFSFRMANPQNRYALETDGQTLFLSKYVNGGRTVLASIAYPFQRDVNYTFKIRAEGNRIRVWLNSVPYFDVTDGSFASGTFGPVTKKSNVSFSGLYIKELPPTQVNWIDGYAIWEPSLGYAEAQYEGITFTDPENDPRSGAFQWTYWHTPKFINNQGLSDMHGKTYTAEQLRFDKVGEYLITLQAKDDPHPEHRYPDATFDNYRKLSPPYQQRMIVHRRPIAQFTLTLNPDKTVSWNDTSYDPDRWASPTNYSTEPTGIDYRTTRGVLERKYFYVSPSGKQYNGQLTRVSETGTYYVYLMVKDEYDAWSELAMQTLYADCSSGCQPPNTPPEAYLIFPYGTQTNPNVISTTRPTIQWRQTDADPGTIFQRFHIQVTNEANHVMILDSGELPQYTTSTTASWTVNKDLAAGQKLRVRVRVFDGMDWSNWSPQAWLYINRAPTADFTWTPNPVWEGDTVRIIHHVSDPDQDTLTVTYRITAPNGEVNNFSYQLNYPYTGSGPSFAAMPGQYTVTQTVSDGMASASVTKPVWVGELTIQAFVDHTPEWEEKHRKMKHNTTEIPKDFYSGEIFVVKAISAPAPVDSVTAWMDAKGLDGENIYLYDELETKDAPHVFHGELFDPKLLSMTGGLPRGIQQIHFQIRYQNGVVKRASVPVNIIGNVHGSFGVHRVR